MIFMCVQRNIILANDIYDRQVNITFFFLMENDFIKCYIGVYIYIEVYIENKLYYLTKMIMRKFFFWRKMILKYLKQYNFKIKTMIYVI